VFGKSFAERLQTTVAPCMSGVPAREVGTFEIVAQVGHGGRLQKVLVDPSTKVSECVRQAMAQDAYPAPPRSRHWVNVHMSFSE
jgi:hypothetical protein